MQEEKERASEVRPNPITSQLEESEDADLPGSKLILMTTSSANVEIGLSCQELKSALISINLCRNNNQGTP